MRNLTRLGQDGNLFLVVAIAVVVLGVVGFAGYRIVTNGDKTPGASSETITAADQEASAKNAGSYTSADDVAKDESSLNTSDIDQSLDTTQLDSDINNLL